MVDQNLNLVIALSSILTCIALNQCRDSKLLSTRLWLSGFAVLALHFIFTILDNSTSASTGAVHLAATSAMLAGAGLILAGTIERAFNRFGIMALGASLLVAAASPLLSSNLIDIITASFWLSTLAASLKPNSESGPLRLIQISVIATATAHIVASLNYPSPSWTALAYLATIISFGYHAIYDYCKGLYLQANSDPLSQLPNRRCLNEQVDALRHKQQDYWLTLINIDGIKQINDTYGFAVGDATIFRASQAMLFCLTDDDFLGRNFAKEFVIISKRSKEGVEHLISTIQAEIAQITSVEKHNVTMSIHCGASFNPAAKLDFSDSLKSSSAALQYSEMHTHILSFVDQDMMNSVNRRNDLEQGLRKAIQEKTLEVHFQPKFDCHNPKKILGAEALARWNYQGSNISPFEFIKLAEECNLIAELDEVIMEKAWLVGKGLQMRGLPIKIAANFSPSSLLNGVSLWKMVHSIIERNQLDPTLIEIEITESYLAHGEDIKTQLQQLRDIGISIAMDDFGTGFSNLGQLESLPLDTLKIDKIFIDKLLKNPTVTEFIVDLAQKLQLQLVAEGVEEELQLLWLSQHSCHMIQGYLLSRPLPQQEFIDLIETSMLATPVLKLAK